MPSPSPLPAQTGPPEELATGFLLGLLVGEGHFGGDGRQPQVTLRMHVRHEGTFRRLQAAFPGGKLYGPYDHGGRHYYQWMVRGDYLRRILAPLIAMHRAWLDDHSGPRFDAMCERYRIREVIGSGDATADPPHGDGWFVPRGGPRT
jgi:hypothetical protein